jgi:hypothetical protein
MPVTPTKKGDTAITLAMLPIGSRAASARPQILSIEVPKCIFEAIYAERRAQITLLLHHG